MCNQQTLMRILLIIFLRDLDFTSRPQRVRNQYYTWIVLLFPSFFQCQNLKVQRLSRCLWPELLTKHKVEPWWPFDSASGNNDDCLFYRGNSTCSFMQSAIYKGCLAHSILHYRRFTQARRRISHFRSTKLWQNLPSPLRERNFETSMPYIEYYKIAGFYLHKYITLW